MTANAGGATNRGVDEVLQETEVGTFIMRNKIALGALLVALIISIVAAGVYSNIRSQDLAEKSDLVYEFSKGSLSSLTEGKIETADFKAAFSRLVTNVGEYAGLGYAAITAADYFLGKKEYDNAVFVLTESQNAYSANAYLSYFANLRLSVAYEDAQKLTEAAAVLEKLTANSMGWGKAKHYLDLGRVYKKAGNTEKAKANLQYVLDNFADSEQAKIAKVMIQGIR